MNHTSNVTHLHMRSCLSSYTTSYIFFLWTLLFTFHKHRQTSFFNIDWIFFSNAFSFSVVVIVLLCRERIRSISFLCSLTSPPISLAGVLVTLWQPRSIGEGSKYPGGGGNARYNCHYFSIVLAKCLCIVAIYPLTILELDHSTGRRQKGDSPESTSLKVDSN